MKYKLTAWEDNGYNDSDFFESYWNDETKTVEFTETGSTRYAGGVFSNTPAISDAGMLSEAIAWLANHIFVRIQAAENKTVMEPEPNEIKKGDHVLLTRSCRHKGNVYAAGTRGEVITVGIYGQFYARGYNRPNRENTRIGIRISPEVNAPTLWFSLAACRLSREPMSDTELRNRSETLAQDCQFSKAAPYKHAWDSENYAVALRNA